MEIISEEKDDDTNTMTMFCASCGVAEVDDVKLKNCDDCDLVRYCSDDCRQDHRPQHEEECEKRAAELKDEVLFKQPESSHMGDCPICCLPVPIEKQKSILYPCCCKRICRGCSLANEKRENEMRLQQSCPFCREAVVFTAEEINRRLVMRIEANDPVAMRHLGMKRYDEGDYTATFEYATKAAALGDADAHFQLSCLYGEGEGVEKDEKREQHHLTEAAIAGHTHARHNLACVEMKNYRVDRAVKHFIIAAKLGCDESLGTVKDLYKAGHVIKEDFAAALRGHHAAIEATKSPQRKESEIFSNFLNNYVCS